MLIMKCPKCEKYISSALLAEISSIVCEHCHAEVPVSNVLVSSNGFTFDRNDLLKRFFRYRKLLDEVIDEHSSMVNGANSSAESRRSIEQFLAILQGMMTGARDNFRYQFSFPLPAKLCYSRHECSGTFFNLSTEGARIEISKSNPLPRVKGGISIEFSLPDSDEIFSIDGDICWTQKAENGEFSRHSVGIRFRGLDMDIRAKLWKFISTAATEEQK
jgi:hypothetical protein